MSVKPMNSLRSTVAAVALAFGAVVALALPAAAAPDAPPGEVRVLSRPQPVVPRQVAALTQAPAAPHAAVALSPAAQHFLAAVRANFAQWDLDHDGVLTRAEIETDMQNPRIVGEAAAALAALKLGSTQSNHLAETRAFTPADIDAMERQLAGGQKLERNFVGYFAAGVKKLQEQPRALFVEGLPRISAIRQDFTSDCYFLSAVGALAQVNPQAVVRLIAPNRDGSFTVSFPGQPPVHVPAPTDSEIATYTIAKDGIWLSVLQKAYAIIRIRHEPQQASTREPLDSVGFRTGSTSVMDLLTGHHSRAIIFPAQNHRPLDNRLLAQTRSEIQNALRDRREVTASNSHHAYAIVAYDAAHDLVTVHNPYDRGGFEAWIGGGDKVRRTEEGFFVIPTERLVGNFYNVRLEEGGRLGS
jgi:Calpain family cysteine protease